MTTGLIMNADKVKEEIQILITDMNKGFKPYHVICLFGLLRKFLFETKNPWESNLLRFYCNWFAHLEINTGQKQIHEYI